MSENYEEVFEGEPTFRVAPGPRHEIICARLHAAMATSVANLSSTRLLPPRTRIQINPATILCPDLALVTHATEKLWLVVEIVDSSDHRADTVIKKQIYEENKVPRLWMIDPRYDNVEVYHGNEYGLALKNILAGKEILSERLVPEFQFIITDLFAASSEPT